MNRRDLLLLRLAADRTTELSCEQLYMRYVDAESDGTTARLFERLSRDLQRVGTVRLVDTSWLSSGDLHHRLDAVLDAFSARGGRVLKGSSC